jgi:hypothetical protein
MNGWPGDIDRMKGIRSVDICTPEIWKHTISVAQIQKYAPRTYLIATCSIDLRGDLFPHSFLQRTVMLHQIISQIYLLKVTADQARHLLHRKTAGLYCA